MITPGDETWVKIQDRTLAEYSKKPFQFAFALIMLTEYTDVLRRIATAIRLPSSRLVQINGCKDIWARDYMPFQRHDGKYLMYKYAPDYLKSKKDRPYRSNPKDVRLGSKTLKDWFGDDLFETDLVIDGGNLIKCYDSNYKAFVITTEKVLYENPKKLHRDIITELEYAVNADVILIPWDKEEPFGHADGMVRYIRPGELLLNCYDDMDEKLAYQLRLALGNRFKLHMLKYGKSFQQESWCHINYIETDDDVLIPAVGIETDELALKQIEKITAKRGHLIKMDKIVKQGGALHCISWELRHATPVDTNFIFAIVTNTKSKKLSDSGLTTIITSDETRKQEILNLVVTSFAAINKSILVIHNDLSIGIYDGVEGRVKDSFCPIYDKSEIAAIIEKKHIDAVLIGSPLTLPTSLKFAIQKQYLIHDEALSMLKEMSQEFGTPILYFNTIESQSEMLDLENEEVRIDDVKDINKTSDLIELVLPSDLDSFTHQVIVIQPGIEEVDYFYTGAVGIHSSVTSEHEFDSF